MLKWRVSFACSKSNQCVVHALWVMLLQCLPCTNLPVFSLSRSGRYGCDGNCIWIQNVVRYETINRVIFLLRVVRLRWCGRISAQIVFECQFFLPAIWFMVIKKCADWSSCQLLVTGDLLTNFYRDSANIERKIF